MTTNAQRQKIRTAGDFMIVGGTLLAVVAAFLGLILLFSGSGAALVLSGVPTGLLLMAVGYLKRIATALTPPAAD
ncbi:hypothetical protein [Arthrobacter sp.]|uniref:hypothetical protein n=1 Tax=Arthrobacter sp. TaxID=1667 RepID=UPI003A90870B